jgi:hypothetical protein
MSNKFVVKYPALWEPKIGDKIKIVRLLDGSKHEVSKWHYHIGDRGAIVSRSREKLNHDSTQIWVYEVLFIRYKVAFSVYREEMEPI